MQTGTVFLLLFAVVTLTEAAAVPETALNVTAEALLQEASPEADPDETTEEQEVQEDVPDAEPDAVKMGRSSRKNVQELKPLEMAVVPFERDDVFMQGSWYCPQGWSRFDNRCFLYVPKESIWAHAERNCLDQGGNLASVHSVFEYQFIQEMIYRQTKKYPAAWLGGTDAQKDDVWLWSDGSRFVFISWCPGEPNNHNGKQHCLQMNHGGGRCWDDFECSAKHPFVCVRKVHQFPG